MSSRSDPVTVPSGRRQAALKICTACPDRVACARNALQAEVDLGQLSGTWAGVTVDQSRPAKGSPTCGPSPASRTSSAGPLTVTGGTLG